MENWKRKGFHIWGQPWIHREYNACVITPMMDGGQDMKVSSIIDPINHCWDINTISHILSPQDVQVIVRTPLLPMVEGDSCIWALTQNGMYTVRSAYYMIIYKFINYDELKAEGD